MPWAPGIAPVVNVAKLVAVVVGNEVVTTPLSIAAESTGIWSAYALIASAPKPSMRNRTSRPLGLSPHPK